MPIRILMISLWITLSVRCVGTDFIVSPDPEQTPRILVTPPTGAVIVGDTTRFQAVYYDLSGSEIPAVFIWTSSDTTIASVTGDGAIRGKGVGQVNIRAEANAILSDPAYLTVVADSAHQVATVTVSPDSARVPPGETVPFSAMARALNGTIQTGKTFTWQSSDTSVATIDAGGLATGGRVGTALITATTDGITGAPVKLTVEQNTSFRTGTFTRSPGVVYIVRGTAILEKSPPESDRIILRFGSDFTVSNGPGIEVFLSKSNRVVSGSVSLGRVKKLTGEQSYDTPFGVKLDTFDWVIIHCVPFNATFGYAQLQ
jgi:hypothetical protein